MSPGPLLGRREVPHQDSPRIAILGGNPVATRALEVLLRDVGHEVQLLGEPEAFGMEDLLDGADVLLLGSGLSDEYGEDLLRTMASTPKTAAMPVLSFSPGLEGPPAGVHGLLPWPCRIEDVVQEIAAVLRPAPDGQT